MNRLLEGETRVQVTRQDASDAEIAESMRLAFESMRGEAIDSQEASDYALRAIAYLHNIAMSSDIYDAQLAKPSLILALDDPREAVVLAAAEVISELGGADGQRALADAALDTDRTVEMRISLLGNLSHCARKHGTLITAYQAEQLLQIVNEARGPLANAVSETYGALNMPPSQSTQAIIH